ncbi:hypothetical protein B14911_18230 [Bacillus sp. NRRL B-14911]|nr:hypothetical protein B14911_18230 [Bacillus sp. NRRL B-14911]
MECNKFHFTFIFDTEMFPSVIILTATFRYGKFTQELLSVLPETPLIKQNPPLEKAGSL